MKLRYLLLALVTFCLAGCSDTEIPRSYKPPSQKAFVPVVEKTETTVNTTGLEDLFKAIEQEKVETKKEIEKPSNVPLSNDNHYINVDGNKVHSPAYAPSRPAGASARCRDGTYSFSQNRRGTCSHHGGVATWY